MSGILALAKLTGNPEVGGGSHLTLPQVSELLTLIEAGNVREDQLETWAEENRGPTPTEWEEIRAGGSPEPEPVTEVPDADPQSDPEETPEPEAQASGETSEGGEPDPEATPV